MAFLARGILLAVVALLTDSAGAAQLSFTGLRQDQSVGACVNGTVRLPWSASTSAQERVLDIKWYFHGNSEEMVAIFSDGHFVPLPGFSDGRVEYLTNAGLLLHHVTDSDKGNYSVVVDVHDASGQLTTLRDSVSLQITGTPMEGHTEVRLAQEVAYNRTADQFHIVLTCGKFFYPAQPPFDVTWLTPAGDTETSTSYTDGHFRLQLPNPVTGGNYTCRVPASAAVCVPEAERGGAQASLDVDWVDARLDLLEAHKQQLLQENEALKNRIIQYINDTATNQVSFHARLNQTLPNVYEGVTLKFSDVTLNQGGAYDAASGMFTVPIAGVYFIAVNTGSQSDKTQANVDVMVNDVIQCRLQSAVYGDMGTCEAVLGLTVGQKVWLRSLDNRNAFVSPTSSFLGFLIKANY